MIYKYSFSISGERFFPEKILDKIQGNFIVDSFFKHSDMKPNNNQEEYGYGNISFLHPNKFSTSDELAQYEYSFINFIEKNYSLFIDNLVNDLEIFMEIYFDGEQCNFEVFDKVLLEKISKLGISLPISIYVLPENEIEKWENEIHLKWESSASSKCD